jgi:hypothetical protein
MLAARAWKVGNTFFHKGELDAVEKCHPPFETEAR